MKDLQEGCAKGDAEPTELMEKHASKMASALHKLRNGTGHVCAFLSKRKI